MNVTFDGPDILQGRAFGGQQLMPDRHEVLGHDMQFRVRHQMMDIGDAAGD
jgi:hypothetical protein